MCGSPKQYAFFVYAVFCTFWTSTFNLVRWHLYGNDTYTVRMPSEYLERRDGGGTSGTIVRSATPYMYNRYCTLEANKD